MRFGGGGVRALVAPMVACVSSVYSYRTGNRVEGPADSRYPKHSLAWGCPRGRRTAKRWAQPHAHQPCAANMMERRRGAMDRATEGSGPGASAPEMRFMWSRVPSVSHLEHPSNRLLRRRLCGSAVQHTRPRGTVVDAALSATTCVGSRCRRSEYTSKRPERGLSAQRTRRRVTKQKPSARHKKWRTAGSPSPRCSSPRRKR